MSGQFTHVERRKPGTTTGGNGYDKYKTILLYLFHQIVSIVNALPINTTLLGLHSLVVTGRFAEGSDCFHT